MAADYQKSFSDYLSASTNGTLPSDHLLLGHDHQQTSSSISESGLGTGSTTPNSLSDQRSFINFDKILASVLFQRLIQRCKSSMKVVGSSNLTEIKDQLLIFDKDIEIQCEKTFDVYRNERQCNDYERIENDIYRCFNALITDERQIMIGLDSISSLKDLLITAMRICSEPDFKLEIRIGFGGTKDSLTLRTPSYAVAGVHLLERLSQLRQQFSSIESQTGYIPTKILINHPILSCFCAPMSAVKVNNLDEAIGKQCAHDILSYLKMYIDSYHSYVSQYVRYEMDHLNTYDDQLLKRISERFLSDFQDEGIKQSLTNQARNHGSDENGSITYASIHLIMLKDIIDKHSLIPLCHLLDQNDTKMTEPIRLYDCIITIGGSVEARFNKVRYSIRQSFIDHTKKSNDDNYHFPLSIRMLSKAGQSPVYYHNKQLEITIDQILKGDITDLNFKGKKFKGIKEDLSILKEDIGISLLKSLCNDIFDFKSCDTSSWKSLIFSLVDLFLNIWRIHGKDDNKLCQCVIKNAKAIDQISQHYGLSDNLNDDEREILSCIFNALENKVGFPFGQIHKHDRHSSIYTNENTANNVLDALDGVLSHILIDFIRRELS